MGVVRAGCRRPRLGPSPAWPPSPRGRPLPRGGSLYPAHRPARARSLAEPFPGRQVHPLRQPDLRQLGHLPAARRGPQRHQPDGRYPGGRQRAEILARWEPRGLPFRAKRGRPLRNGGHGRIGEADLDFRLRPGLGPRRQARRLRHRAHRGPQAPLDDQRPLGDRRGLGTDAGAHAAGPRIGRWIRGDSGTSGRCRPRAARPLP
jgi:hypothetical protein